MISFKINTNEYVEFKKKRFARSAVNKALRSGELKRSDKCNLCLKETRTNAHHIDYGKPLNVIWLCDKCHGECHRKSSPLNPQNNKQTHSHIFLNESDTVVVSVSLPIKNFIALKKHSLVKRKNISTLIRNNIIKEYTIDSDQLEFKFDEAINDKTPNEHNQNICRVGQNETFMLQQKRPPLSSLRRERNRDMRGMESLFEFSKGYGGDAKRSQFSHANR